VLCDRHHGEWRPFFSFTEEEQLNIDFSHASFWCEKHPASPFNKGLMIAIKTEKGRKTLNGREFKEFAGNEVICLSENLSDTALTEILQSEFGLAWSGPFEKKES